MGSAQLNSSQYTLPKFLSLLFVGITFKTIFKKMQQAISHDS